MTERKPMTEKEADTEAKQHIDDPLSLSRTAIGQCEIVANGAAYMISDGTTIADFIESRHLPVNSCVAELNGRALTPSELSVATLSAGDRIEIVRAIAGGSPESESWIAATNPPPTDRPESGTDVELKERLAAARLYVIAPSNPKRGGLAYLLREAVEGGAGIIQLRDHSVADGELLRAAQIFREVADETGALFIVNDRPDIARLSGADGVHVGQDDLSPAAVREVLGTAPLIGLSTHTTDQVLAAQSEPVDYIGVGPIFATPTKEGREPVGLDLVKTAAAHSRIPFFAIGGIDASNVSTVVRAGATHVAVVRAVIDSDEPRNAAATLTATLNR